MRELEFPNFRSSKWKKTNRVEAGQAYVASSEMSLYYVPDAVFGFSAEPGCEVDYYIPVEPKKLPTEQGTYILADVEDRMGFWESDDKMVLKLEGLGWRAHSGELIREFEILEWELLIPESSLDTSASIPASAITCGTINGFVGDVSVKPEKGGFQEILDQIGLFVEGLGESQSAWGDGYRDGLKAAKAIAERFKEVGR